MRSTIAGLGAAPRLLLHVLCALDPDDRPGPLFTAVWARMWEMRGYGGDPQVASRAAKDVLLAAGLISASLPGQIPAEVSAMVDKRPDPELRQTTLALAADQWQRNVGEVLPGAGRDDEDGRKVCRAAFRAAQYLLRLKDRSGAIKLLGLVIKRDESPAGATQLIPVIREIVAGSRGTADWIGARILFNLAFETLSPDKAVREWELLLRDAVQFGNAEEIVSVRSCLALALQRVGRLTEALRVAEEALAGECPDSVSRLYLELRRLQALLRMGQPEQVVDHACELLSRLQEIRSSLERSESWDATEAIFSLAGTAAGRCGRREQALIFQTWEVASKTRRGATALAVAQARMNTCSSLARLGRLDEAELVFAECAPILRRDGGPSSWTQVYGVQADLACHRGDAVRAAELAVDSLKHAYQVRAADVALIGHLNLSLYRRAAGDPAGALADGLAAILIAAATGADFHDMAIDAIAAVLPAPARTRNGPARFTALRDDLAARTGLLLDAILTGLPVDRAESLIEAALTEANVIQAGRSTTVGGVA